MFLYVFWTCLHISRSQHARGKLPAFCRAAWPFASRLLPKSLIPDFPTSFQTSIIRTSENGVGKLKSWVSMGSCLQHGDTGHIRYRTQS